MPTSHKNEPALLKSARAVMETKRLSKGAPARDTRGREVSVFHPNAYAVDPLGAVLIAAKKDNYGLDVYAKVGKILSKHVGIPITSWSDDPARSHRDVIELMKKAFIEYQ